MASPMLPVTVPEALDPHHSRDVALYYHLAYRAVIAGVSIVYYHVPGNRAAANHDFC